MCVRVLVNCLAYDFVHSNVKNVLVVYQCCLKFFHMLSILERAESSVSF